MNLSYAFRNGTVPSAGAIMADHASNLGAKAKEPFPMKQFFVQRAAKQAIGDILDTFRDKAIARKNEFQQKPGNRVTLVKKLGKNLWRASGLGHFEAKSLVEVKKIAKDNNYTHVKVGAVLHNLSLA